MKEQLSFIQAYILLAQKKDKSVGNKQLAKELGISRGEVKRARIQVANILRIRKGF